MVLQKSVSSLPYKYYFFPVLVLTILGLIDSTYLLISHYKNYTDVSYSSFCAISQAINCDTVAQSPWSIFLGVPIALWGITGYILFLTILFLVRENCPQSIVLWKILFSLSLLFSLISLFLGYISATKIHSYCILCITNYCISFLLLFYSWIIIRRFDNYGFISGSKLAIATISRHTRTRFFICLIFATFTCCLIFFPRYWKYMDSTLREDIQTGITVEGHPWIGAINPVVTIEEYSDYQCFACYKTHFTIRQLILKYPEKLRLVHRHYPMDHDFNPTVVPQPFHIGSGKMSLLAIYAMTQNNFWKMNDALFQLGRTKEPFNTKFLSEKTDIPVWELNAALSHPDLRGALRYDIWSGMKRGITATPTFIINDEVYTGFIPQKILELALE